MPWRTADGSWSTSTWTASDAAGSSRSGAGPWLTPTPERPTPGLTTVTRSSWLLAQLTERERRVVVLRHCYDLSEANVACVLGIAPGTVKSTLACVLAKLRVLGDAPVEEEMYR